MRTLCTVLCTSGLAAEAKIARAAGFPVVIGAGDRGRTAALVERAALHTDWLVSFGIAGGLAPTLGAGTVIVSGEVIGEDREWRIASPHRDTVSDFAKATGAAEGPIFGAGSILATPREKDAAWAATRALAVDLESDIVARTAASLGIPFVVLRTVADTAQRRLPSAALIPLTADGRPDLRRVFADMLRRPSQITEMIALAREARRALEALIGPARALRGALGAA